MKYLTTRAYRPLALLDETERFFNRFHDFDSIQTGFDVDIAETKDAYVIAGNLPGFTAKDVDVRVEGNLLVIEARILEDVEEKSNDTTWHYRERRRGHMKRSFVLPEKVDRNRVEAVIKDGVLSVTLSKTPESSPLTISVKGE